MRWPPPRTGRACSSVTRPTDKAILRIHSASIATRARRRNSPARSKRADTDPFMGQLVVNGLALGSIYALVALGLLLIFNTVQIVNFAQGQLLMLGAFIGISCAVTHELPVAMAWAITMLAMALVGIVFMVLVYFPLRGRPAFLVILTTIAMGIVLENLALIVWGPLPVSLPSAVRLCDLPASSCRCISFSSSRRLR